MVSCTLNWFADRGFELELEAAVDDVTIRMAAVPVPVDGTAELSAAPVPLDRLAILFKAQSTVDGAMGQLQEVAVQLAGAALKITGVVEDVETAELRTFGFDAPVRVPEDAPEAGGPRPIPTDEDSLDWEDDQTLESMIVAAPESGEDRSSDPDDDDAGAAVSQAGLERLLKAILSDEPEADEAEPAPAPAPAPAPQPPPPAPADEGDQLMDADQEAEGFLRILLQRELLELEDGFTLDALVAGTRDVLALPVGPDRKAAALSEWLLDQPAIADLYAADEDLAALLAQW